MRVSDTAERSQVDQRIGHHLHAIVPLLEACKAEQQPLARIFPRQGPLNPPPQGHCQLIDKIPNKWVKHLTIDLLTPCIVVHKRQGKSQEIGYLLLS
jgi:hypothetical protein